MTASDRYVVMTWMRGNHSIIDTDYPIGHSLRRLGRGFRRKRDAEAYARNLNRRAREEA